MPDLILGTAGHIDHGKTSLIAALTGIQTDRLPEEKKRGITIELGYAHLEIPPYRLGIVDVPGHEKFVRQMLAGATGMDLTLLVIAGDDSVKQQTTEHLDILKLLDLPAGVIALTKCDLCDPDWLDLVEEEIRQVVAGSFLEQAPIIRTSAKSGLGLEALKSALAEAASIAATHQRQQRAEAPFRMAIDRSFTIEGHGTVVTGSVNAGTLHVGDTLELQPAGSEVRVRGIQNHDTSSETVARGQRAAINIAGVHHQELGRGDELAARGHLQPSECMTVRLNLLESAIRPLKDRSRVRVHLGTAERMANVRLLEGRELAPGEQGLAQLFLDGPAVAVWHQPLVIRQSSPVITIGGGVVLQPRAQRIRKPTEVQREMLWNLDRGDELQRASASLYFGDQKWSPDQLTRDAGITDPLTIARQLEEAGDLVAIELSQSRTLKTHRLMLEELAQRMLKTLERMHRDRPLRFHHARTAVEAEFTYLSNPELLPWVIDHLKQENRIIANVNSIGLVGYGPKLSKGQKSLLAELVDTLKQAGVETPAVETLIKQARKNKDSVAELLEMASENGELIRINDEYYLHRDAMAAIHSRLESAFSDAPEMTMSEIRQVLDTSRKYAIPILEFLDRTGITIRDGDLRRWSGSAAASSPTETAE